jgi:hypothetical protein
MAHGDYECCAVCDDKLSYDSEAAPKDVLCSGCAVDLAQRGVFVHDVAELAVWMKAAAPVTVVSALGASHFRKCAYTNDIDKLYDDARARAGLA